MISGIKKIVSKEDNVKYSKTFSIYLACTCITCSVFKTNLKSLNSFVAQARINSSSAMSINDPCVLFT